MLANILHSFEWSVDSINNLLDGGTEDDGVVEAVEDVDKVVTD